jgi:hypothetical protein
MPPPPPPEEGYGDLSTILYNWDDFELLRKYHDDVSRVTSTVTAIMEGTMRNKDRPHLRYHPSTYSNPRLPISRHRATK